MRKISPLFFLTISILGFTVSCKHSTKEATALSDGIPGEVMVVSEEETLPELETIFKNHFTLSDPNLVVAEESGSGKYEPVFKYYFTREKAYEGTEKQASSILVWNEADQFSKDLENCKEISAVDGKGYSVRLYKNVWAKPQVVVYVELEDKNLDAAGLQTIAKACTDYFKNEAVMPGNLQPNGYVDTINQMMKGGYGFGFTFPPQFRLEYKNNEVVWLRQETTRFYRDLFVNIFSDSNLIDSKEKAIENRDHFSRKYLKNDEGTLVLVSKSPSFRTSFEKEKNVYVLRGWYQEEGTFRRGPFIRYFFHDQAHKRYVALDEFVYAPDMGRNMFYRTFEIIGRSFAFEK